jgi:hypothetical protein|tara:strand:- start:118 stop:885 length:768 start_codon:yes stop_codon:yes gene_type:complete
MKVLLYQFHMEPSDPQKAFFWGDEFNRPIQDKFWELSSDNCKKYAEKYGFDYVFDNPNEDDYKPFLFNCTNFERFKIFKHLEHYDAILWVDSDVLIVPNADNIVEKYNTGYSEIVVNTSIGDKAIYKDKMAYKRCGFANGGVQIFYRYSDFIDLHSYVYRLKYNNINIKDLWWKNLHLYEPLIAKIENGRYNNEQFLQLLIDRIGLHVDHLDRKYNYSFNKNIRLFEDDSPQFIHFLGVTKKHMKRYFNLIENMI